MPWLLPCTKYAAASATSARRPAKAQLSAEHEQEQRGRDLYYVVRIHSQIVHTAAVSTSTIVLLHAAGSHSIGTHSGRDALYDSPIGGPGGFSAPGRPSQDAWSVESVNLFAVPLELANWQMKGR